MLGLILKLQKTINVNYGEEDIYSNIARYLLKRLRADNTKLSIHEIANDCYTSAASVSRFVKKIGFNSFFEFKQAYLQTQIEQTEMKIDLQVNQPPGLLQPSETTQHFDRVCDALERMNQQLNVQELKQLAQWIDEATTVHLFATQVPGNIAEMFQHELLTAGKYCTFFPLYVEQIKQSQNIEDSDLIFFISLDGGYVMQKDITFNVTSSKAKSVLITQNPTMKLSASFDYIVALGEHDHESVGKYKLMMFFELLARNYYQNYI